MRRVWVAAALAFLVGACSDAGAGDAEATNPTVEIPDDATFCSVFTGQYREALGNAVPVSDPAFVERTSEIVAWAQVLATLAPDEIADEAQDNLGYHRAQAAITSAADFIPGSNALHEWANGNC